MNAYATQAVRRRNRICWQEEYILGMVQAEAPLSTTAVIKLAEDQAVMSQATTHKYLKKLVAKKLVTEKCNAFDGRGWDLSLSTKGGLLLKELKDAYK